MVYLWEESANFLNRDIGTYDEDISPDRFLLRKGQILTNEEFCTAAIVYFEVKKERVLKFDCLPNTASIPLVNSKVKRILESIAPNEIQFLKAKLICKDGELDGYDFLNITHLITGIDHQKSIYTKMKLADAISDFQYLTYLPGCMGELHLARDADWHGHLLVTEKSRTKFIEEQVSGVEFIRPEEYYHPITIHDLLAEEARLKAEELISDE